MIGADLASKQRNANVARSSAPVASPAEIELIRQLNAVDIARYSKARELFEVTVLPAVQRRT